MRNLKGKSEDAAGSDAIESFKDEHLDTKAVDTRQKRSREKLQISLGLYHSDNTTKQNGWSLWYFSDKISHTFKLSDINNVTEHFGAEMLRECANRSMYYLASNRHFGYILIVSFHV